VFVLSIVINKFELGIQLVFSSKKHNEQHNVKVIQVNVDKAITDFHRWIFIIDFQVHLLYLLGYYLFSILI
jgi:hypothetical protein